MLGADNSPWENPALPRLLKNSTLHQYPYKERQTPVPVEYDASIADSLFLGIASPHQTHTQGSHHQDQASDVSYPTKPEQFILDADISHLLGEPLCRSEPNHRANISGTPGSEHIESLGHDNLHDFDLDQNLFAPHEFDFEDPQSATSEGHDFFEQTQLSAFPPSREQAPITPAMLAANRRASNVEFTQQRVSAPQDRSHSYPVHSRQSTSVYADLVFTPLVSPMVAASDIGLGPAAQTAFEPLSSPALRAHHDAESLHHPNSEYNRRRSSLSAFGIGAAQGAIDEFNSRAQSTLTNKRRTPHGTPILHATQSSSILAHGRSSSPAMKAKISIKGGALPFERLPEASVKPQISNPVMNPLSSDDATFEPNSSFMGFTMRRLADQSVDHENSYNHEESVSPIYKPSVSRPSEEQGKAGPKKNDTHKMAEQGRRNRMNVAVSELAGLIPQQYHDQITVPSKATTIELGSQYIRDLLEEVKMLKNKEKEPSKN